LVYGGDRKSDKLDAQSWLGWPASTRNCCHLSAPQQDAQANLALIRSRDLVGSGISLVNHVGEVKAFGAVQQLCQESAAVIPEELLAALEPVLAIIES